MSSFIDGLARRALGVETTLTPLIASRYERTAAAAELGEADALQEVHEWRDPDPDAAEPAGIEPPPAARRPVLPLAQRRAQPRAANDAGAPAAEGQRAPAPAAASSPVPRRSRAPEREPGPRMPEARPEPPPSEPRPATREERSRGGDSEQPPPPAHPPPELTVDVRPARRRPAETPARRPPLPPATRPEAAPTRAERRQATVPAPAAAEQERAPDVHVSIGHIEVRAPAEPPRAPRPAPATPALSLRDYLRSRDRAVDGR